MKTTRPLRPSHLARRNPAARLARRPQAHEDTQIAHLHEKLHDDADEPKVPLTVRGKGYMFAKFE